MLRGTVSDSSSCGHHRTPSLRSPKGAPAVEVGPSARTQPKRQEWVMAIDRNGVICECISKSEVRCRSTLRRSRLLGGEAFQT